MEKIFRQQYNKNITIDGNEDNSFNGSVITELEVGDVISLGLESSVTTTVTPSDDTSVYLNIVKIG